MGSIFGGSSSKPYGEQPPIDSYRWDAEYDPETGEPINKAAVKAEAEYDKWAESQDYNILDAAEKLGSLGKQPGALAQSGRLSSPSMSGGRRGSYSAMQSPYQTPTYLASSLDYNKMVNQLVTGLLKQNVRRTKLSTLV